MRQMTVPLAFAAAAALITAAAMSVGSNAVSVYAQARPVSSYAEDRAAIEDLQARYLFALDFHDPDLYVSTFTPDGVLDYGSGGVSRAARAIKDVIAKMPEPGTRQPDFDPQPLDTISRISSLRSRATKHLGARIGSTIRTTTRNAGAFSTGSGIMRTSW